MTKKELIEALLDLPDDATILMALNDDCICDFILTPITESCDDPTVIGYVITEREAIH